MCETEARRWAQLRIHYGSSVIAPVCASHQQGSSENSAPGGGIHPPKKKKKKKSTKRERKKKSLNRFVLLLWWRRGTSNVPRGTMEISFCVDLCYCVCVFLLIICFRCFADENLVKGQFEMCVCGFERFQHL